MRRTFFGTTGVRGGMNRKSQAQEIAVIRSSRNTSISDASGVKSEAPNGVRLPNS